MIKYRCECDVFVTQHNQHTALNIRLNPNDHEERFCVCGRRLRMYFPNEPEPWDVPDVYNEWVGVYVRQEEATTEYLVTVDEGAFGADVYTPCQILAVKPDHLLVDYWEDKPGGPVLKVYPANGAYYLHKRKT